LSEFVAEKTGLHFPPERWSDLQRGLAGAATEFGFEDVAGCAEWLLSAPLTTAEVQTLASHLTIGETYFFREKPTFEVLAHRVLPGLIRSRRGREQRLRLWSAGCCTGEEAYSLAIMLRQLLPDLADWQVTILATDINPHFLRKAVVGSYGEWSFRDAPAGFKELHFHRNHDGRYVVAPEIKAMVTIEHLNLVEDGSPSLATDTNAMDLIFCRNVLMYFTPAQTRKVIAKLHHALLDGGWLAVSPSEASQALFPRFATRNFPGVILYQKSEAEIGRATGFPRGVSPISNRSIADPGWNAEPAGHPSGRESAIPQTGSRPVITPPPAPMEPPPTPPVFSPLARALANQGKLAEALIWCDRWIAADKLDAAAHYLRAVVLLEQGDLVQSHRSLRRTVYLQPDFVLAHFVLGNLARSGGRNGEADKHFSHALHLLGRLPPHTLLPESDGLTAARLTATITALTSWEPAR
jgi:chemotaxis protein methyltransferase CheR